MLTLMSAFLAFYRLIIMIKIDDSRSHENMTKFFVCGNKYLYNITNSLPGSVWIQWKHDQLVPGCAF